MVRLALFLLWFAVPALAEGNMSLTIMAGPMDQQPVVGQMINVTIRAVYDHKIANEKLEIDPSDAFDWIQTRADDWREERIDGLPRIVMERHLAVWPKRAGMLYFGPARHRLTIIDAQSRRQNIVVEAKPLALSVGEYPAQKRAPLIAAGFEWRFAAAGVELTDELSTNAARLADGEQVVRTVTLRALGVLPEHLPPRPVVSENWLITFAAPVQRELILTENGPVAEVIWKWQFRPHTGEPGMLEPVKIPYFNTKSHKIEVVQIPELFIGYASFYTGQTPRGRIEARQTLWLLFAGFAGLIFGLAIAMTGYAPKVARQKWMKFRARWSPFLRLKFWQAKRRNDLLTVRRLAGLFGQNPERLTRIEQQIYGRPNTK